MVGSSHELGIRCHWGRFWQEEFGMKDSLPQALYRAEQTRELDRLAIAGSPGEPGIAGFELMQRAAGATFNLLLDLRRTLCSADAAPADFRVAVFCGAGNNGGDGYVVAGLAREAGFAVTVYALAAPSKLTGDALLAYQWAEKEGVPVNLWAPDTHWRADLVVDALLGTGLKGSVRAGYATAIAAINQHASPVLAVDIPSGLCSDTGQVLGAAVEATHTVTFIGCKQGLLTGQGPAYTGQLHFTELSVPKAVYQHVPPSAIRLSRAGLQGVLPPRRATDHKGKFGHLLVVGGNHGMAGAAVMAAEAALYCGAGKVTVATRPEHAAVIHSRSPQLMVAATDDPAEIEPVFADKQIIVIGPGLGQDAWAKGLLQRVLALPKFRVIDADGLNLLTDLQLLERGEGLILTPHPGEAAHLLGASVAEVQEDRFRAVRQLSRASMATVVLKGAGTLIADPEETTALCSAGNPGMGIAGMGDLLSGVIGALAVQGVTPGEAARYGVWAHATAADRLARSVGERGLQARELLPHIRAVINGRPDWRA
jgi:NAD(P)H-hydrate epimerase